MQTIMNLFITTIFTVSIIIAGEAKLGVKSTKLTDLGVKKSDINLTIEAEEDIYGIQFDIRYNAAQLRLTEDAIVSNIPGVKIYSRVKDNGIARVLMFGITGEKILDVSADRISDLIDIKFKPEGTFRGTSVVELYDITLAGKAGIEVNLNRSSDYSFEVSFLAPQSTSLSKNYPNPFNPTTAINYELAEGGMVSLIIYDLKGAIVKTLVEEFQEGNYHNIVWDGLNDSGQAVSSGRYILKMSTPRFSDTITMTLLK